MNFWSYKKIEQLAEQRLREYESRYGNIITLPVPLDKIIENHFGLKILWEKIEERDNECILGGLRPKQKQIVMNEGRLDLFKQKDGLENSTKGHELGHWDLFVDKDLIDYPQLVIEKGGSFLMRDGAKNPEGIRVLVANMYKSKEAYDKLLELEKGKDDHLTRRLVDKYASALTMPASLLKEICANYDLTVWSNLYKIREIFGVTITALTVRMQQLSMIFIKDGVIYRSREECSGQLALLGI